jgi:hypothetical protein
VFTDKSLARNPARNVVASACNRNVPLSTTTHTNPPEGEIARSAAKLRGTSRR